MVNLDLLSRCSTRPAPAQLVRVLGAERRLTLKGKPAAIDKYTLTVYIYGFLSFLRLCWGPRFRVFFLGVSGLLLLLLLPV